MELGVLDLEVNFLVFLNTSGGRGAEPKGKSLKLGEWNR